MNFGTNSQVTFSRTLSVNRYVTYLEQSKNHGRRLVNFLFAHAVPKDMTLSDIQPATLADPTLQQLTKMICTGNWEDQT